MMAPLKRLGARERNKMLRSVLVTGANAGLGRECARQLSLRDGIEKIYLGCRSVEKAQRAKEALEATTGKSVFEVLLIDVSNLNSVRAALERLQEPLDALVMNAGGSGGENSIDLTDEGVTRKFAVNVLGHALLLEELLKTKRLGQVAIYAGSETARGVPKVGAKRPMLKTTSVEEIASIIDGSFFDDAQDPSVQYAYVKYVAALWMSSMARKYTDVRIVTVSPGGTSGTNAGEFMPPVKKFVFQYVAPILLPLIGMMHNVEQGAKRYLDVLYDASYESGVFYGSREPVTTGPLVDQSTIFADLRSETFQDNAREAIYRFLS